MTIDYKNLAMGLIDILCDREDVTEVIILLLNKGYSREEIKELEFFDEDIDYATQELEYRLKEEQC